MNRNGQTLIIFVIMIPIILLLAALVVDVGLLTNEKMKLSGTTTTILKEYYELRNEENLEENIKSLYQKNNIPVDKLEIKVDENDLIIKNEYEVKSIFGSLIGIKSYPISIHKKVIKIDNEFRISKE